MTTIGRGGDKKTISTTIRVRNKTEDTAAEMEILNAQVGRRALAEQFYPYLFNREVIRIYLQYNNSETLIYDGTRDIKGIFYSQVGYTTRYADAEQFRFTFYPNNPITNNDSAVLRIQFVDETYVYENLYTIIQSIQGGDLVWWIELVVL